MKTKRYGKSNHRKCLRIADTMAKQATAAMRAERGNACNIPEWAGLAWIISPFYNYQHSAVRVKMGEDWHSKAVLVCRALCR